MNASRKLLRRPEVEKMTSLSRAGIYALMNAGDFPRTVRTGARSVAWRESEIETWISERPVANPSDIPVARTPKNSA